MLRLRRCAGLRARSRAAAMGDHALINEAIAVSLLEGDVFGTPRRVSLCVWCVRVKKHGVDGRGVRFLLGSTGSFAVNPIRSTCRCSHLALQTGVLLAV